MKKSFSNRIRITKNKKVLRRRMGVNHFRSKKRSKLKAQKRKTTTLKYPKIARHAHAKFTS
jgi:ribosomal protein L35